MLHRITQSAGADSIVNAPGVRAIEEVLGAVYSPAYHSDNDFYNQEALLAMGVVAFYWK